MQVDETSARWLQGSANNSTSGQPNDAQIIRDTFVVYGAIFAVVTFLFCIVRLRFPKAYTIRQWVEDHKTSLADDQLGFISWVWKLFYLSDDQLRLNCGMDSLCFIRVLRMGFKMSLVGIFNAIWLLPLYATAEESPETTSITDGILEVTIAHVPSGSTRLAGTVVAAYILFGYTMHLILRELDWFSAQRRKFLSAPTARNYTVYVRNIPVEYLSNRAVEDFFRLSFPVSVLQAQLRVKAPKLSKLVAKRATIVAKLEHAMALERRSGRVLTHQTSSLLSFGQDGDRTVNSVEYYCQTLQALNEEIAHRIDDIRRSSPSSTLHEVSGDMEKAVSRSWLSKRCQQLPPSLSAEDEQYNSERLPLSPTACDACDQASSDSNRTCATKPPSSGTLRTLASAATNRALSAASMPLQVASSAAALLTGPEDGELYTAGFVTFSKLSAVHATLQMVQNEHPFSMEIIEAPDPDDVWWANVGRCHKDLQIGFALSMSAATAICFLWTIPMAFIAALSSVGALRQIIPFIDKAPFLEPIFALVAPLLVPIVNSFLPTILEFLSKFEGPISGAVIGASTFGKLSAFMIIQTFFVSAISGGILQALTDILNNPTSIVDLLANSLPSQATYFIQIVFIGTVIPVGVELLRVVPLVLATLRRRFGPNLTDKERNATFLGLRPLSDPPDFPHADLLSQIVLYFTVQLVYAVIAPVTSFVLAFCFLYLGAAYLHQIVFIYPTKPDSGGKLWTRFIRILITCMLIAELTVLGLLVLKKSVLAIPMMVPLFLVTVLFNSYIQQEHFRVANYLPLRCCSQVDRERADDYDFNFLRDAYVQPELSTRLTYPTNPTGAELPQALRVEDPFYYFTPNQSEAEGSMVNMPFNGLSGDQ